MKKILLMACAVIISNMLSAQDEEGKVRFKKQNIFIGTGINIGAGSGMFQLGLTPEIGYSITKWLDAGALVIVNYQSQNNYYYQDPFSGVPQGPFRVRNFNYGTGGFIRIWPFNFLHLTAQPEFNWIKSNITHQVTGEKGSGTFKSGSFLVGIGYGSRDVGRGYHYLTLMKDLRDDDNSPYRDPSGRSTFTIKAGVGLYLGRGR